MKLINRFTLLFHIAGLLFAAYNRENIDRIVPEDPAKRTGRKKSYGRDNDNFLPSCMIQVTSLDQIDFSEITICFNEAFSDYFVTFNATESYLRDRWYNSGVAYDLSCEVLENGRLVGFVITAVGQWREHKTAYNAGTSVVPASRRKGYITAMYKWLYESYRKAGITHSILGVICENENAIRAYQKFGFELGRRLLCFKREHSHEKTHHRMKGIEFTQVKAPNWETYDKLAAMDWHWEGKKVCVKRMGSTAVYWELRQNELTQGYGIFYHPKRRLLQWGFLDEVPGQVKVMFLETIFADHPMVGTNLSPRPKRICVNL